MKSDTRELLSRVSKWLSIHKIQIILKSAGLGLAAKSRSDPVLGGSQVLGLGWTFLLLHPPH